MEKSIQDRIAEIKGDVDGTKPRKQKWWTWKKTAAALAIASAISAPTLYFLGKDFLVKRQNYPERNVLFRTSNTVYVAGNEEKIKTKADKESVTQFFSGGIESKVGTYLFETKREERGDIEYYSLDNSQRIRVASSTQKPEKFQAGLRVGGSLNFREQFAEVILDSERKDSEKYMVYKVSPERGWKNIDSDVVEFPEERGLKTNEPGIIESTGDKKIVRLMVNRLVEKRNSLGWLYGKNFRDGTILEDYSNTPENQKKAQQFFEKTKLLDSSQSLNKKDREELIEEILKIEESMEKSTIYHTYEDGFFKWLPQESTIYLEENPNAIERLKNFFGIGQSEHKRLRVENYWDLWPGNIPFLKEFHFGKGENEMYPFDKYNNGGYVLKDKFGKLAKINIRDFLLFYGQDVLYEYFLDLNGNGKIEEATELIGSVLCRTTHDGRVTINEIDEGKHNKDLTFTVNYSFMAPDDDQKKGMEYFKLCAYIESFIPDQINRGFGTHSLLGLINNQRSDVMLYQELGIKNMSRALTQESTLTAKEDIQKLLRAAHRPYSENSAR